MQAGKDHFGQTQDMHLQRWEVNETSFGITRQPGWLYSNSICKSSTTQSCIAHPSHWCQHQSTLSSWQPTPQDSLRNQMSNLVEPACKNMVARIMLRIVRSWVIVTSWCVLIQRWTGLDGLLYSGSIYQWHAEFTQPESAKRPRIAWTDKFATQLLQEITKLDK